MMKLKQKWVLSALFLIIINIKHLIYFTYITSTFIKPVIIKPIFCSFFYQVNLCFDQFVYKLADQIFAYYKAMAGRYEAFVGLGSVAPAINVLLYG